MQAFATPGANKTNKFAALVKKSCSPQLATSLLLLLWMDEGKTSPESSKFLGGSYNIVAYLRVDGNWDHLESRRDTPEKDNYTKEKSLMNI
jgi:hypothetical protein